MKNSREKTAANRAEVLHQAGILFREHGFAGVGVADITRRAGLTHGGFYGQFASKDALAAEACGAVCDAAAAKIPDSAEGLRAYLDRYLSAANRDARGRSCPLGALATDAGRAGLEVQARFATGMQAYLERMAAVVGRERAILLLSAMVGAVELARATAAADPALSAELLASVRRQLDAVVPTPPPPCPLPG